MKIILGIVLAAAGLAFLVITGTLYISLPLLIGGIVLVIKGDNELEKTYKYPY